MAAHDPVVELLALLAGQLPTARAAGVAAGDDDAIAGLRADLDADGFGRERLLGLPNGPDPFHGAPWKSVLRS